ncbi:MAG: hypothetical protein IPG89_05625 [Bacteroidetes bacterium]|nr:hypothetical protein [Bacteroidota bacterium]
MKTKSFNDPIVKKSKKILLLGKSKTKYYFEKFYNEFEYTEVLIHPSERSKQNNEDEWKSIWETNYIQNKYLI